MRVPSLRTAAAALAALLLLAGCKDSSDDARAAAPSTPPASQPASAPPMLNATPAPTEAERIAGDSQAPSPTAVVANLTPTTIATPTPSAPTVYVKNLPEGAYPGAGGPLPEGAVHITANYLDTDIFQSPSGNILCNGHEDQLGCYITSWVQDKKYPEYFNGELMHHQGVLNLRHEGSQDPGFTGGGTPAHFGNPQVLEYGQVGTTGDFACASMESGLTCWSLLTGNGVLLNRSGYYPFYRDN